MRVLKKIKKVLYKGFVVFVGKIIYRYKVIGLENIPEEGPLLFCGNHRSYIDPAIIVATSTRPMRFLAKEELKNNIIVNSAADAFDAIYIKRDSKDISAMKEALKTLKTGGCIGIFPEGTRNGFEKNDGAIKGGAIYLAMKTNANIVPIGIVGPQKPFTKNAIIYGKPIEISKYKTLEKGGEEEASNALKNEIVKLANSKIEK